MSATIADIYRDLDILPSHPLWREVQHAMREFGGSLARLLCDIPRPRISAEASDPGTHHAGGAARTRLRASQHRPVLAPGLTRP